MNRPTSRIHATRPHPAQHGEPAGFIFLSVYPFSYPLVRYELAAEIPLVQ
jgi:hypothetical protein